MVKVLVKWTEKVTKMPHLANFPVFVAIGSLSVAPGSTSSVFFPFADAYSAPLHLCCAGARTAAGAPRLLPFRELLYPRLDISGLRTPHPCVHLHTPYLLGLFRTP